MAHNPAIRWLIRRDLPNDVPRIDFECYEHPWTEEDFLEALRQRNVIGNVIERSGDVVGFMVYELHKDHLNLVRLAVHPNWQRQGVGRELIERLWDKLSSGRRRYLECVVSERSDEAHSFLKACGFWAVGVERDYVRRDVDGYRFRLSLGVATLARAVH